MLLPFLSSSSSSSSLVVLTVVLWPLLLSPYAVVDASQFTTTHIAEVQPPKRSRSFVPTRLLRPKLPTNDPIPVSTIDTATTGTRSSTTLSQDQPSQSQDSTVEIRNRVREVVLWSIPLLATLLSFVSFGKVAVGFHSWIRSSSESLGFWIPRSDVEVDLQTQVVTQVINGPVITSVSLLFAALVSTTVSTLHNRQLEMRRSSSRFLSSLRALRVLMQHERFPSRLQDTVRACVISLEQAGLDKSALGNGNQEMDTVLEELAQCLRFEQHETYREAYDVVKIMRAEREQSLTTWSTGFPTMHYVALGLLGTAISISFLVATDQSMHILESLQVRLLWSILIGSFTSLAVVCYDLSSPFAGAYTAR